MATNYKINWSDDTLKNSFPVLGTVLNTANTSFSLPGRNTLSWGEIYNENMIRLLENFASNGAPPANPTIGQFWFNAATKAISIFYDGRWNPFQYTRINSSGAPSGTSAVGDLWYDTTADKLKVRTNSGTWVTVCSQCPTPTPPAPLRYDATIISSNNQLRYNEFYAI